MSWKCDEAEFGGRMRRLRLCFQKASVRLNCLCWTDGKLRSVCQRTLLLRVV